jgi:hypothetical protein
LLLAAAERTLYALVNPNHKYRPSIDSALILSPDPLGAALIAAAAELAGLQPAFAMADEAPRAALRRLRPVAVLIGTEADCLSDGAFLGPAKMTGARLFVFGSERQLEPLQGTIARYGLETLMFPRDAAGIVKRLRGAIESSPRPLGSTAP